MRHPVVDRETLMRWLALSRESALDEAIRDAHQRVFDATLASAPICTASARCCDFRRFGHDLFVTGLEVAWTLDRIPRERVVTATEIEQAEERGNCPFLVDAGPAGRCGIHPARPMGCRVFFCDPTRERFVQDLAERGAQLIREIHDRFEVPYLYAEWRGLLRCFAQEGIGDQPSHPAAFEARDPFVPLTRGNAS